MFHGMRFQTFQLRVQRLVDAHHALKIKNNNQKFRTESTGLHAVTEVMDNSGVHSRICEYSAEK